MRPSACSEQWCEETSIVLLVAQHRARLRSTLRESRRADPSSTPADQFWQRHPASDSACLGAQNLQDRHSIRLGKAESVPLPTGFVVGIALVLGVISGGTTAAVLMPESQTSDRLE